MDIAKFQEAYGNKSDGLRFLLEQIDNSILSEYREWAAYALATVRHECGASFEPVKERVALYSTADDKLHILPDGARVPWLRGKNLPYLKPVNGKVYLGRGYVQLTWEANYKKFGDLLGIDLVGNPDMALEKETAFKIMCLGMIDGLFTGCKLSDTPLGDFVNKRKIINGLDEAQKIAGYAQQFMNLL